MRPIDHKLIFFLLAMMGVLGLWFFKRSWLENEPAKSVVRNLCVLLAVIGIIRWLVSPGQLEFLMLLFPIAQFYAYSTMFAAFHRKYHRRPTLPSLANIEGAAFPDQVFNFTFLGIAVFIPFICGGIILMKLAGNI
jgi:hypothetical protein